MLIRYAAIARESPVNHLCINNKTKYLKKLSS